MNRRCADARHSPRASRLVPVRQALLAMIAAVLGHLGEVVAEALTAFDQGLGRL
jgi:hypothetical protein